MKWLHIYTLCAVAVCLFVLLDTAISQTATVYPDADVETRHVPEGSNLTLACNTTGGSELSNFFWTRDSGGELYARGRELEFPDVSRNDSAVYSCWALDGETGENVTLNDVGVDVQFSPGPDPDSSPTFNHSSSLGETVAMTLEVASNPTPSYTWSRDDGRPLGNVTVDDGPRGTTLTIYDVGIGDFGNYTLVMNNSVGSYEASFSLEAYGRPEPPYNLSVSNIVCDSADIAWTSGFDMGSHEEFLVMRGTEINNSFIGWSHWISEPYENSGVGQVWTYRIPALNCNTEYEFVVLAKNAVNHTLSETVKFNTTDESPPEDNSNLNRDIIIGVSVGGFLIAVVVLVAFTVWRARRNARRSGVSNLTVSLASQRSYGGTREDSNGSGYPIYKRDYLNDSTTRS